MSTDVGDTGKSDVEDEIEEIEEVEEEIEEEEDIPEPPVFMRAEEPTGKEDKAKFWILKDLDASNEEIAERHNLNANTVRIARSHLADDGFVKRERQQSPKKKAEKTALLPSGQSRSPTIFAKGSPPEAIIESIKLPIVADGQGAIFESGMKFGMTTLVLATRVMSEIANMGTQNVKPLIDLTRAVREGEQAAFKSGADEAAMKAAQAMGGTILPMISDIEAKIETATRGSETDPVKSMMVRTMEPIMNMLMKKVMPGMDGGSVSGWTREKG